jgi:hypothetical protein
MKKIYVVFCCMVFAFGVLSFSYKALSAIKKERAAPSKSFQVVYLEYNIGVDGNRKYRPVKVQTVNEDNTWTLTTYGKVPKTFTKSTDGLSVSVNGEITDLGKRSHNNSADFRKVEFYENHPDFVGTGEILGLKTYTLRAPLMEEGGWLELSHSTETGRIPLKYVIRRTDGSVFVSEAVKLEFK